VFGSFWFLFGSFFDGLSSGVNPKKTSEKVPGSTSGGLRNKRAGKVRRQFSAQALARMGRPAKFPEAKILAERYGVSYSHAYMVCRGTRPSPIAAHLPAIRAEIAASAGSR
jgi:hypothetical protein